MEKEEVAVAKLSSNETNRRRGCLGEARRTNPVEARPKDQLARVSAKPLATKLAFGRCGSAAVLRRRPLNVRGRESIFKPPPVVFALLRVPYT